ncbi:hypothetical protein LIER_42334 [Lithospermum erythrorhizon]|uniref:DUF547 domain-containing protein n=1 Tax=Lithospermum erythrorhizon TaxID=34254 RepID=A0AAV3RR47_LITER
MVRCMAAVYYWLCSNASSSPQNLSSQSTNNDLPPREGISEGMDWLKKCTVEISWISTDKKKCARASSAISNYKILVEQLERVNICKMEKNTQIAFWINMYNSLVMHAHLAYGLPQNSLRRLSLFHKAAYNVGGHIISASAIEQSIFCLHTPRAGKWLETIISTAMKKRSRDERQIITSSFGLEDPEPLVCFALCSGAISDPMVNLSHFHL